jgi:hypothetical protein
VVSDDASGGDNYKEVAKLTYESFLEMRRLSFAAQAITASGLFHRYF